MKAEADKFSQIARALQPDCCQDGLCYAVDQSAADEFNDLSQEVYREFTSAGYKDEDWDALMERSGAAEIMKAVPPSLLSHTPV